MGIPNLGPKAVAGHVTDKGHLKLFLDADSPADDSIVDVPVVFVTGPTSIVDNGDGTISITMYV